MKSFSAFQLSKIDNPHVEPIRLVGINVGSASLTLCDRAFDPLNEYYSKTWDPIIISHSTCDAGSINPETFESSIGQITIVVDNTVPVGGKDRFSEHFKDNDPQSAYVEVTETYQGGVGLADLDYIMIGYVENIVEITNDRAVVLISSFETKINNQFQHTIVDPTTYPGADPDDVGKMVPMPYGKCKRVPAVAVDAGGKTTIAEAMTETSPGDGGTLEVTDGSRFPSSGGFIVQVDVEQIDIASRSGNVLTLAASAARGYGGTTAVAHDNGAAIAEIKTEYVYLLSEDPVEAINEVYVDNIRQTSGFTAYTGQNLDEKAGYEGKAVVVFSTLPVYAKQVNLDVSDNLDVDSSNRSVDDTGHAHSTGGPTISTLVAEFQAHTVQIPTVNNPQNLYDGSAATQGSFTGSVGGNAAFAYFRRTSDLPGTSGTPKRWRIGLYTGQITPYNVNCYGLNSMWQFINPANETLVYSDWKNVATQTWAYVNGRLRATNWCYCKPLDTTTTFKYIRRFFIEIEYEIPSSPTETSYAAVSIEGVNQITGEVTLSGNSTADTVIGTSVAVDVDGIIDDGFGDITGTPNLLIERPDHICKYLLIKKCGLSGAAIETAYYNAAGSFYATNSFTLAVPVLQKPNIRALLTRIATQSKSIQFWDAGEHYLKPIEDNPASDKAIDDTRVDLGQIYSSFTERSSLQNRLTARFDRHWSGYLDEVESDRAIVTADDAASQAEFGVLQGDPLSFPYITNSAQAAAVLAWLLSERSTSRLIVEFAGGYYLTDLQVGDVIYFEKPLVGRVTTYLGTLTDESLNDVTDESLEPIYVTKEENEPDTYLENELLGLVAMNEGDKFRIIEKQYRSDFAVQLRAIAI